MSAENKFVIKGEASESDEETEANQGGKQIQPKFGSSVDGEAPESDEDIISYCKETVTQTGNPRPHKRLSGPFNRKYDSFLQRKLIESNSALWRDLNNFIQGIVLNASKQLLSADQHLLKSQVSLQTASHSMKVANVTSKHVLDRTKDVVTAKFIPSIRNINA